MGRRERAYAYLAHPQLRHFAESVAPRLRAFGYDATGPAISGAGVAHMRTFEHAMAAVAPRLHRREGIADSAR